MKGYKHSSNTSISVRKWMNSFELIMNKCGVDKVGYTKAVIPLYVLLQALKRSVIAHARHELVITQRAPRRRCGKCEGSGCAHAAQHFGFDNGADGFIARSTPSGAETVGHFAEDHRGAQPALRYVVRWRHIAAGDEDEKFVLAFLHAAPELEACLRIGLNRQKAAEAALEIAPVNQ